MKFLLSSSVLAAAAVASASGQCLDAQFGQGGNVLSQFGSLKSDNVATAGVAVNPKTGRIAVVGYASQGGPTQFAVSTYLPSGAPDTSFDGEGQALTTVYSSRHESGATSAAFQSDDKLVVAGAVYTATHGLYDYDFAAVRYASNGALDASFGNGGKVSFDFNKGNDEAAAVSIQPDGKIVLAGHSTIASGTVGFAAARLNADGSLDSSFGSGGKVTTAFGPTADRAHGMALLDDGSMVLAGTAIIGRKNNFALLKYTSAGVLDASFGTGGKTTTAILGDDSASAVKVQADGKLVVVGSSAATTGLAGYSIAVARYLANGKLDASFGTGGVVLSNFGYHDAFAAAVVMAGSNIVVAGYVVNGESSNQYAFAASFTSKGAIDNKVTPYFESAEEDQVRSTGVALDNAGRVIVASTASIGEGFTGFGLSRLTCLASKSVVTPPGELKKKKKKKYGLRA